MELIHRGSSYIPLFTRRCLRNNRQWIFAAKILAARHRLRPGKERQPNHGPRTCPASDKQFHCEFSVGEKVISDVPKNDLNISSQWP